jgi:hypothetical protein
VAVDAVPEKTADTSPLVAKLESVTEKAIGKLDEIMSIPLEPESEHYAGVLRAQNAAANTALITQTRVDDAHLRRRQTDMLPKLLAIIAREQARLPPKLIENEEGNPDGSEKEPPAP